LKDGRDLGVVTFEADPDLQNTILQEATNFQKRVFAARELLDKYRLENPYATNDDLYGVVANLEPEADNSEAYAAFLSERHKARETEVQMQGTEEHQEWAVLAQEYSQAIKSAEDDKRLYQNKLKQVMEQNGATVMNLPDGKITWRKQFLINLK
jgi:predicted phage-related endonuclease